MRVVGEGFEAHVAAGDGPLVVLFGHDRSYEADDRGSGGEDPDHVGAAEYLPVEALLGVVGPDLPPVLFGEPAESQPGPPLSHRGGWRRR